MSTSIPVPQAKYELLSSNPKRNSKINNTWFMFGFVIIIMCTSTITVYLMWQKSLPRTNDEMDFMKFGSLTKDLKYVGLSHNRAEMYSLATFKTMNSSGWIDPMKNASASLFHRVKDTDDYKMVCYYTLYSESPVQLLPSSIDPFLCTHITIAFAAVVDGTVQPATQSDLQVYKEVTGLKKKNPDLKVMLSVVCFTSTGEFASVVSTPKNRTRFAEEAVKLLEENSLDGLDIDWEFPAWPTGDEEQRKHFTLLLKELRHHFDKTERKEKFLISVAVAAPEPIVDRAYDIPQMAKYVDFVSVMAYDFHFYRSYLPLTGANAPLYPLSSEKGYFATLNTNWSSSYWVLRGMPQEKVIVGLPTYGHSFTLMNVANSGWNAPASGIGKLGFDGFVSYFDSCKFISLEDTKFVFDAENKVPYAYRSQEWISFDNEQSLAYKAEYTKEKEFGGVMVFSLNTDDFNGVCDTRQTFPLTRRIKNVMQDDQL